MKTSEKGIEFIKQCEGYMDHSYQDAAQVWTIGYGTTRYPDGRHVSGGEHCTTEQATEYLRHDLARFEDCINHYVTVELTQNQFDALASFTYNLGCGALKKSTLLRKLNARNYEGAADEMLKWTHAGGHVLRGLVARRSHEHDTFLA